MNTNDSSHHPYDEPEMVREIWRPQCIPIDGGPGKPSINIMDALLSLPTDPTDPYACLAIRKKKKKADVKESDMLIFPPEVYSPKWEERSKLEAVIIKAAADHANTKLIRQFVSHDTHLSVLACCFCRRFYDASKGQNPTSEEIYHIIDDNDPYTANVRMDFLTNNAKGSRGVKGRKMSRRKDTTKPALEEVCKFKIQLDLVPGKYWYIQKVCNADCQHSHMQLNRNEETRGRNSMSSEDKQLSAILQQSANSGAAQNVMKHVLGGSTLSQQQLHYNYQLHQDVEYGMLDDLTGKGLPKEGCNAATKMMKYLQHQAKNQKMRYVALFHEVVDTKMLAVSKAQQRAELSLQFGIETSEVPFSRDLSITSKEATDSVDAVLRPLRERLKVGQKILLAVAWCREDERALFNLFPEVLQFDVTFGTNNECRPLGVCIAFDGNMKTFCPAKAFLPSQCQWVFGWFFGSAFPILMGRETLWRTQLLLTDGDSKIYQVGYPLVWHISDPQSGDSCVLLHLY
jgi:hypothetical protein